MRALVDEKNKKKRLKVATAIEALEHLYQNGEVTAGDAAFLVVNRKGKILSWAQEALDALSRPDDDDEGDAGDEENTD